jgi:hypothetical protein
MATDLAAISKDVEAISFGRGCGHFGTVFVRADFPDGWRQSF